MKYQLALLVLTDEEVFNYTGDEMDVFEGKQISGAISECLSSIHEFTGNRGTVILDHVIDSNSSAHEELMSWIECQWGPDNRAVFNDIGFDKDLILTPYKCSKLVGWLRKFTEMNFDLCFLLGTALQELLKVGTDEPTFNHQDVLYTLRFLPTDEQ